MIANLRRFNDEWIERLSRPKSPVPQNGDYILCLTDENTGQKSYKGATGPVATNPLTPVGFNTLDEAYTESERMKEYVSLSTRITVSKKDDVW